MGRACARPRQASLQGVTGLQAQVSSAFRSRRRRGCIRAGNVRAGTVRIPRPDSCSRRTSWSAGCDNRGRPCSRSPRISLGNPDPCGLPSGFVGSLSAIARITVRLRSDSVSGFVGIRTGVVDRARHGLPPPRRTALPPSPSPQSPSPPQGVTQEVRGSSFR